MNSKNGYRNGRPLKTLRTTLAERDNDVPASPWLPLLGVEGIIARGCVTMLAGAHGSGKTTLLVHACREWVRHGLKVVFLSDEPFLAWDERAEQFPELEAVVVNEIPLANATPERWAKEIHAVQPDVVIIDPVWRFTTIPSQPKGSKVRRALRPFISLAHESARTAVIFVHYLRKRYTGVCVNDVLGSYEFGHLPDTILYLLPDKTNPYRRNLIVKKSRLWGVYDPTPYVYELSPDHTQYRYVGGGTNPSNWQWVKNAL